MAKRGAGKHVAPKPAVTKQAAQKPTAAKPDGRYEPWDLGARILASIGLVLLIASLTVFKMSNNDIWIHLKTGETILETLQVPDKDPYSFTASDHDYVAHEWLSGVVFYLAYAAGGVNALIFFKAAIIFGTCAALYAASRFAGDRLAFRLACFTLMLFIGSARFLERPHIFSYLFEALYLMCYFAYRGGGRHRGWLYAIPLLHILWTNLHGGHFQGLFLLAMLAAAESVMYFRAHGLGLAVADASPLRDVLLVCALPVACLLTALINPYGYRLLTFPFELTGQEIFMKQIYEWQSALFPSYNLSSMFVYYIVWIALLFGSFLAMRGHAELSGAVRQAAGVLNLLLALLWVSFIYQLASVYKSGQVPSPVQRQATFWYAVVALFLLANIHRLEFHHAGIVALFFALSMRHNRAVTDAAVATLPTLSHNLSVIWEQVRRALPAPAAWIRPASLAFAGLSMCGLAAFTFSNSYHFGFDPPTKREMGLGIASNMPVGAVDYIERNRITGNCFPSYNAAAMLIHRMWPEVKVSMDSRNDVYGEALYREYTAALTGGAGLQSYLRKWTVDFFLITYGGDRNPAFFRYLDDSPEWTLVYFDDRAVVYLRTLPRFQEILRRDGYELISPAVAGTVEIKPELAERWLAEAEKAAAAAPGAWSPLQYRSKALLAMNRLEEAEASTRKLLELNPEAYFAWADLGFIHLLLRQEDLAAQDFTRCLELRPDFPPCRDYLARLRRGAGER